MLTIKATMLVIPVLYWFCACDVRESAVIEGMVTAEGGEPLPGIFVSTRDTTKRVVTTVVTNEKGAYAFKAVTNGVYEVRAVQVGFTSRSVIISTGVTNVNFTLSKTDSVSPLLPSSSYLSQLPDGADKRFISNACMGCHQFNERVIEREGKRLRRGEWMQSINKMVSLFGPGTTFPIIPPLGDNAKWAAWFTNHFGGKTGLALPREIKGDASKVIITEYDLPVEFDLPHDLSLDSKKHVVITGMFTNQMYVLNPTSGEFRTYAIPLEGAGPRALEIDGSGNMWVALGNARTIGKFDPKGRWRFYEIKEYPHSIAQAKDGTIWFNSHFSADPELIGSLDTVTGVVTWFEVPSGGRTESQGGPIPYELRIAPDGVVWGSELNGNRIFKFNPASKEFSFYRMPTTHSGPRRFDIGPDGVLWIPEYGGNNLTKFDPKTQTFKQYAYPTSSALPYVVRVNKKTRDIWLATAASDEVARFDPTTEQFTIFRLPSRFALIRHMDIDSESGAVWVAYASVPAVKPKIARIEVTLPPKN